MPGKKLHNSNLNEYARALRKNQTSQERKLWTRFLRELPVRFRRQVSFGNYIVDFYCCAANLVIELDGGQHFEIDAIEYDKTRDDYLRGLGLTVLRYTNLEIDTQFEAVCNDIYRYLNMGK